MVLDVIAQTIRNISPTIAGISKSAITKAMGWARNMTGDERYGAPGPLVAGYSSMLSVAATEVPAALFIRCFCSHIVGVLHIVAATESARFSPNKH